MISYLKGKIIHQGGETITILVNNAIGYDVFVTDTDREAQPFEVETTLYCYHHISDRTQELYGFPTQDRRDLFALLIAHVDGVGPKSALKLLNKIDSALLKKAVKTGNAFLLKECGVGEKTAEKLIIGLRDKLENTNMPTMTFTPHSPPFEALEALASLGYTKSEIQTALSDIDSSEKDAGIIVKEALRKLSFTR